MDLCRIKVKDLDKLAGELGTLTEQTDRATPRKRGHTLIDMVEEMVKGILMINLTFLFMFLCKSNISLLRPQRSLSQLNWYPLDSIYLYFSIRGFTYSKMYLSNFKRIIIFYNPFT